MLQNTSKKLIRVWARTPAGDTRIREFATFGKIHSWAEKNGYVIYRVQ